MRGKPGVLVVKANYSIHPQETAQGLCAGVHPELRQAGLACLAGSVQGTASLLRAAEAIARLH